MDDLLAFLRARLDEDERVARAAHVGPWRAMKADSVYAQASATVRMPGPVPDWMAYVVLPDSEGGEGIDPADAEHIAHWGPARVLAEVEAKRKLLDTVHPQVVNLEDAIHGEFSNYPEVDAPELLLKTLALPHAGHPDYRKEWRP